MATWGNLELKFPLLSECSRHTCTHLRGDRYPRDFTQDFKLLSSDGNLSLKTWFDIVEARLKQLLNFDICVECCIMMFSVPGKLPTVRDGVVVKSVRHSPHRSGGRRFEPRQGHTRDCKNGTFCLLVRRSAFKEWRREVEHTELPVV